MIHPSHGIAILHIHRNDQWEDVYYRRIREHFKTIWLLRYADMIRDMRLLYVTIAGSHDCVDLPLDLTYVCCLTQLL